MSRSLSDVDYTNIVYNIFKKEQGPDNINYLFLFLNCIDQQDLPIWKGQIS